MSKINFLRISIVHQFESITNNQASINNSSSFSDTAN